MKNKLPFRLRHSFRQGDVHAGHYYAFIRPSSGHQYGDPNSTDTSGKWYKFNDETVYDVDKLEAVDNCFGMNSDASGLQFTNTHSSAYMLVYVRIADGATVMDPNVPSDIPVELETVLNFERERELKLKHDQLVNDEIREVSFSLETDIANFSEYTPLDDFLVRKSERKLQYLKGSSRLGGLLAMAEHLQVSPFRLRIFNMASREQSKAFRLCDDSLSPYLSGLYARKDLRDEAHLYVHVYPADSYDIDATFAHKYEQLRAREAEWLEALSKQFESGTASVSMEAAVSGDFDWVALCGIARSTTPLRWLRNKAVQQELTDAIEKLTEEAIYSSHIN